MVEIPFYILLALGVVFMALGGAVETYISRRSKKKNPEPVVNPPRRQELVSDKKHGLRYLERGGSGGTQWSWTCECGRRGVLSNFDAIKPTEERAILDWRKHVETHARLVLPTNELSHQECDARFVGLWALFSKYRKACYCQQTNDDLILLNQEVKTFEKVPEKGVQLEA